MPVRSALRSRAKLRSVLPLAVRNGGKSAASCRRTELRGDDPRGQPLQIVDSETGLVHHKGKSCPFPALPKEVLAIQNDGGLIPHVKKLLGKG
jgi:hypothetical protein